MVLLNLLSAGTLYTMTVGIHHDDILEVSIGITFAQFCVTVVWSLIKPCLSAGWRCRQGHIQLIRTLTMTLLTKILHELET